MQISSYIDKTAFPEPVRLKILFLCFPKAQKEILHRYLKEPLDRPSVLFSKTLEQLKCEILEIVNYNKHIALVFSLISAVVVLSTNIQTLEVKLLGIFTISLTLILTNYLCSGIFSVLKYASYKSFKKALEKLDSFHLLYNNKFRCGMLPSQSVNSPILKTAMQATQQKPQTPNTQLPKVSPSAIFERSADTTLSSQDIAPPKNTNTDVSSLLKQIKTATDNLDLDCFEKLSQNLTDIITTKDLTDSDHDALQKGLDECLEEFRGAEVRV